MPAGAEVLILFGGFSKHGFSSSWLSLLHLGTATGPGAATTPDISYAERTTAMSRSLGADASALSPPDQGAPRPAASAADGGAAARSEPAGAGRAAVRAAAQAGAAGAEEAEAPHPSASQRPLWSSDVVAAVAGVSAGGRDAESAMGGGGGSEAAEGAAAEAPPRRASGRGTQGEQLEAQGELHALRAELAWLGGQRVQEAAAGSALRAELRKETAAKEAAFEAQQLAVLQLQALGKQLQEQAAAATAVHSTLDACGLLTRSMMTSFATEMASLMQVEVQAGCMEPRVRERINVDLQRRLLTWATEAHQVGHRLEFVEDTQLLQAVAVAKGALQQKLELSQKSSNELQLQLSAERAEARRERARSAARSSQVLQVSREAVRRAQQQQQWAEAERDTALAQLQGTLMVAETASAALEEWSQLRANSRGEAGAEAGAEAKAAPARTQRPRNQSTTSGGRSHAPASLGTASAAPSAARPTSAQVRPARPTSAQARQQAARAARPASAQVRSLGGDGGDDEVDEVAERAEAATALQARVRGRRSRLSAADEGGDAAADARVERAQASLLQAGGRPTATQSAAGATSFHAAQEEEENAARTLLLQEPSAAHRRPSVQDRVRPTDQRRRGSISS